MFNNYFIYKYQLDDLVDNSPPLLKHSSSEVKAKYLYDLVSEALKDLLPHFKSAQMDLGELDDFPLTEGRIVDKPTPVPAPPPTRPAMVLGSPNAIDKAMVEATVTQLQTPIDIDDMIQKHMLKCSSSVSSSRTRNEFSCKLCSYKTKYESICVSHVANCLKKLSLSPEASLDPAVMEQEGDVDSPSISPESVTDMDNGNSNDTEGSQTEHPEPDFYWNFKCGEFFLDSLFAIATIYEKYGDGLGMMIQSKMLLPLLLGLGHTNYTARKGKGYYVFRAPIKKWLKKNEKGCEGCMQTSLITDGNCLVRIDRVVDTVEGEVEDGEEDPQESPGGSKWVTTD